VELFGSGFDRVPAENQRASRYEFAVVWFRAENQHDDKSAAASRTGMAQAWW
jgi:hypothetical protein